MCYNTLTWQGEQFYSDMIGGALGNMDAVLNILYMAILGLTVVLVMLVLRKPERSIFTQRKGRLRVWFLCLVCLEAPMFSTLLAWTPVSSNAISDVQGRYLLPFLPMSLLSLKNNKVVRMNWDDRGLLSAVVAMGIYVVLCLLNLICLRV